MPTYWDFRKILNIHPESDYRCVAITHKGQGERCQIMGKWMNRENLTKAANLLNAMDRTKSLSECRGQLDNLAYLTMCGSPHRKMKNIREDRCMRWNNTISAYIASGIPNRGRKAHVVKSKMALDMRSTGVILAETGNDGCAKISPVKTESSEPQSKAYEYIIPLAGNTAEPGRKTVDPFTNDNGITRGLQPQPKDITDEKLDTKRVYKSLIDTTCEILGSNRPETEDFTEAHNIIAMKSYTLPLPSDPLLVSHALYVKRCSHSQSSIETPTKAPKSTNYAQLDFLNLRIEGEGEGEGEKAEESKSEASLKSIQKAEELPTTPSKNAPSTNNDEKTDLSEPLETTHKLSTQQSKGLMTPATTLDPSQKGKANLILAGGCTIICNAIPEPPKTPINANFHFMNQAIMTPETTPESLQLEYKAVPVAIMENNSKSPERSIEAYGNCAIGPLTPDSTPKLSRRLGISITHELTNGSLPERVESFGHALVDFSERRYKIYLSETQPHTIIQTVDKEDTFDDFNITPFTTSLPLKSLAREYENYQGAVKNRMDRRWSKRVQRYVQVGYEVVSSSVRRKSERVTKLNILGTK